MNAWNILCKRCFICFEFHWIFCRARDKIERWGKNLASCFTGKNKIVYIFSLFGIQKKQFRFVYTTLFYICLFWILKLGIDWHVYGSRNKLCISFVFMSSFCPTFCLKVFFLLVCFSLSIWTGIYYIHFALCNLYAFSLTASVFVCILFIPSNKQRLGAIL